MEAVSTNRRAEERRAMFCLRLQTAYRARLGRRAMWRKRKLWVHARETRAAIVIQCAVRVHLAWKRVKQQRAIAQYLKFVSFVKPDLKALNADDLLIHAAIKVQGAWRRKLSYKAARRMKGAKMYYTRMRAKYGKVSMEQVNDLAASKMQALWKGKKARNATKEMRVQLDKDRREKAAIAIQRIVRGRQARKRVKAMINQQKMRRLGGFFRNSCFLKCWMTWVKYTDESLYFKGVAMRTLGRWLNRGLVAGFNALRMYAQNKKDKRVKVHRAAMLMGKRDSGPRDKMFGYWADYMDDKRELWVQVQAKCSHFLHLLASDTRKTAFVEWKEIMVKDRKAKKRRTHYKLFQGWKAWNQIMQEVHHFKTIHNAIKQKWTKSLLREGLYDFRGCVDELLYNRSLVADGILMWLNTTIIHAFRAMDEFAQAQIHYRKTVATFRRRYELRSVMPMIRSWHEWTAERMERKQTVKKAVFKLYQKMIASCWDTWINIIRDRKLAEREMAAKGSKTLMRIAKRPMVVGFESWKKWYEEQRRHRKIVSRISYRWRNANVVLTFNNWIVFVDLAIEERRQMLREAVLDAMRTGNLESLLRTAKQQHRKYARANLEEVMKQVLEEEHGQVHAMVSQYGLMDPRMLGHAGSMPVQGGQRGRPGGARGASPTRGRGSISPPRGRKSLSPPKSTSPPKQRPVRRKDGGVVPGPGGSHFGQTYEQPVQGPAVARPQQQQPRAQPQYQQQVYQQTQYQQPAAARAGASKSKSFTQILPPYLRTTGARTQQRQDPGKGRIHRSNSEDYSGPRRASSGGGDRGMAYTIADVQSAFAAPMPGMDEDIYGIDVGDTTAYPLLGFDAALPERSYESVKASLTNFEQATTRPGKRRGVVFPPIRQARNAWPAMDDREEVSVGMTGNLQEARVDTTLPPVQAAPISMPVMVDDD